MAEAGQDHLYKKVEIAGANVDHLTGCVGVIDINHLVAHRGLTFHASGKQTGLLSAGVEEFYMIPDIGTTPHWSRMLLTFGDGDIDVETFENTIVSAPGILIPSQNTNRTSSNTAGLKLYASPTITAIGDPLHVLWAPPTGGIGGKPIGISDIANGEEWIMQEGVGYAVRITNNSGGTITWSWEALWLDLPTPE